MSLQAEIIPFTLRTGTGTQTIPHVRYPSVLGRAYIFMCASNTGTNSQIYSFGVDDGTTHIGTGMGLSENIFDASGTLSARGYSTQYSLITEQAQAFFGGAQMRMRAYVSAINVGSVEITTDLNNTPGAQWYAVMIGGDDVECKVGLYDVSGGSGDVDVGFDPVAVIKLSTVDAASTGENNGATHSYGFAVPCDDNQVGFGVNCAFQAASSYQLDGTLQADITATSTTISDAVSVSAWITDGWSLTMSGTPEWNIGYLAIGGSAVSANLVPITQPTSTGVQTTTITATDPVIAFLASTNKTATVGAGRADANISFGVHDGVSDVSFWWGRANGASRLFCNRASTTKAITMATATGLATSTLNADASCSLAPTALALNWSNVDATQRQLWALVLAQNLTGSTNNCGANPQASITVLKVCTPIAGGATVFPFGATGGLSPSTFTLTDGASQLFSAVSAGTYGITESAPDGWTPSYTVSNGDPHDAIVVSGTDPITVTVTNTFASSTQQLRVLRRFALPFSENKEISISRLEVIAQMGVGNASAPAPVMQIRISTDGGQTWGSYRSMSLGAAAAYTTRAYITRVARGRNLVAELICDDAVFTAFVQCVAQASEGTS